MKFADVKRAGARTKSLMFATASLVLAVATTGCGSECVDAFDCRNENGPPPAGQQWTCASEKCVTRPIQQVPEEDAGTDAGTDLDAGTEPEPDAGTDPEADAGTGHPCESASHDPVLGTLQLQAGFETAGSAPMPDDVLAVAVTPGPTHTVYAVRGSVHAEVYSLGIWPDLAPASEPLFNVLAPEDRGATTGIFPNGFLVHGAERMLAGYTKAGAAGIVSLYDIVTPGNSNYVNSPGNMSAAAFESGATSAFLINSMGLSDVEGFGIYALVTSADPVAAEKVATFPETAGGNGFSAVANNGVSMFGFAVPPDYANVAYAVAPSVVSAALSSGTPFALDAQHPIDVGSDFNAAAAFGDGVVVKRGSYNADWAFVSTDVSRYALSEDATPGSVTIGERTPVLSYVDQCTSVTQMTHLGSDLLVGIEDMNGERLVRIRTVQ